MNLLHTFAIHKHKNSKFIYYISSFCRYVLPKKIFQKRIKHLISQPYEFDLDYISYRVNYYNKLSETTLPPENSILLKDFIFRKKNGGPAKRTVYFFDSYQYTRYFPDHLRLAYLFGDITTVPEVPSIVKSRPIEGNNKNSILMKLDKVRHFIFLKDKKSFTEKKNMLIGRSVVSLGQPHRMKFWEMYFGHPMCDLGQIDRKSTHHPEWDVPLLPIDDHLDFKFILCLEGNDVASNLKWVMSSNSLAVMPRPTYETWFMEGTLKPDFHYVEIKKDYSDLEEKLNYYIHHPEKAQMIIENAHKYIEQFKNKKQEDLISLLVLQKYFEKTGQINTYNQIHSI